MKKKRYFAAFVVLFVLLLLFLVMNLCIGSVNIPFSEIPKILQGIGTDETYTEIVTQVRAPRAFAAVILGNEAGKSPCRNSPQKLWRSLRRMTQLIDAGLKARIVGEGPTL